eukprot:6458926-Amphidinium_carterae.2
MAHSGVPPQCGCLARLGELVDEGGVQHSPQCVLRRTAHRYRELEELIALLHGIEGLVWELCG